MAKVYARMVESGVMTIDEVPALWQREVQKLLSSSSQPEEE